MSISKVEFGHFLAVVFCLILMGDLLAADAGPRGRQKREQQAERRTRMNRRAALLENVTVYKNLVYGSEHPKSQALDIYVPDDAAESLPLVVWIHGGAWRAGDKANCRALDLLRHGYVVASINYRLTDVAIFPAQIHDCKAAVRFLRAHAEKYKIDPDRIGVWGSSAGGHLVALLGVSNGNKKVEGKVGDYSGVSSDVQAVCDWFGPSDMFTMPIGTREFREGNDPEIKLIGGKISEKQDLAALASPVTHVNEDAPPFLIMHGDQDRLVPVQQSRLLHEKLKASGVDSTLIVLEGRGHGFRAEPEVMTPIVDFFERTLKNSGRNLVAAGAVVEKVASGYRFTEGIAADKAGDLYFSDIPNQKIHKLTPVVGARLYREHECRTNGLGFNKEGELVICESSGKRRLIKINAKGEVVVLAQDYQGKLFNSLNDLWIDPDGGIYVTDPRYGRNRDDMQQSGEHVYYVTPNHKTVIRVIDDMVGPNGITASPDGHKLYVADHKGKKTWVYDIQADGTLAHKKLFADEGSDGMTVDERGNVYITNQSVKIYSPMGRLIGEIEVPEGPTNVCFGREDGKALYITARTSVYAIEMNVKGVYSN